MAINQIQFHAGFFKTILTFLNLEIFPLSISKFKQSIINKLKPVYNKIENKQLFYDKKQPNDGNKIKTNHYESLSKYELTIQIH